MLCTLFLRPPSYPGNARRERQRADGPIVIRGNNEAQTPSDTNSTGCVGRAPDQAGYQLACTEVWSGNNISDELLKLPGLAGLVHSKPVESATSGGDVYYVSVCDKRVLSRVVLADVAGHGEAVARISTRLRMLIKKYINTFDQSALMREINEAFYRQNEDLAQYATAVVPQCRRRARTDSVSPGAYLSTNHRTLRGVQTAVE